MSTLPTSEEMSWLFSSPGSVFAIAIWRSRDGLSFATLKREMSPPNSSRRLMHQGLIETREPPARDAVLRLERLAHQLGIEQAERALEDRAELLAGLEHVDRVDLHERLQALGEGGLAASDRPEQVEDLLALLEPLGGVAEEADDPLDRLLHAVELGEGGIAPDRPVHEDPPEARIPRGVDHLGLADRGEDALRGSRIEHRVLAAG